MKSIFDTETRNEVINRISSLNADSKAQWGKMTVGQMVKHCSVCEEYYHGNVQVKRSLLGRLIGRMAIKSILKNDEIKLGKNAPTAASFKVTTTGESLEAEKEKWKSLIENYATYGNDHFVHWFFGNMTKEQLGQFIYKHCDHHLRQFNC